MVETYAHLEPVEVALLSTQSQVRELTKCDGLVFHGFPQDANMRDLAEGLFEWIDFTGFVLSDLGSDPQERRSGRRSRYEAVLQEVTRISALGFWVLAGVTVVRPDRPDARVIGVISITSRKDDPAGGARKMLLVDSRHWRVAAPAKGETG